MTTPKPPFVLGVDGGGTKTLGAIVDVEGNILARETFPSTNPHSNPTEQVRDTLRTLVTSLCERANLAVSELACICMGMAGCDSDQERQHLIGLIAPVLSPNTQVIIVNDAVVALVAVVGRLHGMLLIAGTGSICLGNHQETGATARCGGWGHVLGDEGSGYMIGVEALKALLMSVDGRIGETVLTERIMTTLKFKEPRDVITWTYRGEGSKTTIAELSRLVMDADAAGDFEAGRILDEQAAHLARLVPPVYNRLFKDQETPAELGLWGGNLIHADRYRERFLVELSKMGLPVEAVLRPEAEAVLGAARHGHNLLVRGV